MKNKIPLLFFILFSVLFPQNSVEEFCINKQTRFNQTEPKIASDGKGNFIVVWTSPDADCNGINIYAQKFNKSLKKVGQEFRINSSRQRENSKPFVTMNKKGKVVVVWSGIEEEKNGYDIFASVFYFGKSDSRKIIRINDHRENGQSNPKTAIDNNGSFVVVWHSWFQDGSDRGIYAKKYDQNNNCSKEFQVNTTTRYSQCKPAISLMTGGGFVIAWESYAQDDSGKNDYGIYSQLFDSVCKKLGNEVKVNTYIQNDQFLPAISSNDSGDFVVTWTSWEQDGDKGGIYAQKFNKDGSFSGPEFRVNNTTKEYQYYSDIIYDNDGTITAAWSSWKQDGDREGIIFRRFDKGLDFEEEMIINKEKQNYQITPAVLKLSKDEYFIVWATYGVYSSDYDIAGRKMKFVSTTKLSAPE